MSAIDNLREACSKYDTRPIVTIYGVNIEAIIADYDAMKNDVNRTSRDNIQLANRIKGQEARLSAISEAHRIESFAATKLRSDLAETRRSLDTSEKQVMSLLRQNKELMDAKLQSTGSLVAWESIHFSLRNAGYAGYGTADKGVEQISKDKLELQKKYDMSLEVQRILNEALRDIQDQTAWGRIHAALRTAGFNTYSNASTEVEKALAHYTKQKASLDIVLSENQRLRTLIGEACDKLETA